MSSTWSVVFFKGVQMSWGLSGDCQIPHFEGPWRACQDQLQRSDRTQVSSGSGDPWLSVHSSEWGDRGLVRAPSLMHKDCWSADLTSESSGSWAQRLGPQRPNIEVTFLGPSVPVENPPCPPHLCGRVDAWLDSRCVCLRWGWLVMSQREGAWPFYVYAFNSFLSVPSPLLASLLSPAMGHTWQSQFQSLPWLRWAHNSPLGCHLLCAFSEQRC